MMREYWAEYVRDQAEPEAVERMARITVHAESFGDARELARAGFVATFGALPAALGFRLVRLITVG